MHNHSHSHSHGKDDRIGWTFFLNVSFTIIEFIGGWLTNSTAIMADAVHDLGDSLSIGFAWILSRFSDKEASDRFSYGYRRLTLFGALINSIVLVIGSVWVLFEAIPRLSNPEMPMAEGMLGLALLGVAVNGYAVFKLKAGKTLNEKVLTWHLLEDVLGWVAVLIVSIVLLFVDLPILDPLLSIGFTLFILFNVLKNLKTTLALFLQATPDEEVQNNIEKAIKAIPEINGIHHMHFWSLDGESHVLTAHLELAHNFEVDKLIRLKQQVAKELSSYNLSHTTIEFEFPQETCRDEHEKHAHG
ncbi:MAG: cobalt-zinc-cadmium efflux system protein [Pseudoalteromonas tetraodonis]|jgi:cobalt-zinc-cadmium efflux system protein|uniref:Cobalt transporter n=8 Tax=Pseudoalteromonas TaxID=53246 RepID=A0AA37W106_9GAMM|nr:MULTISPECIES: cation diffusion facilitator family transporter [Gammaproteobacteria]MCP5079696.1 cation transporter [Psychromonas sp.]MDC9523379.1 cation diffusion facilitator family transporter [Pseudoalteromonas sp. Angola-31]GEK78624.1 cobalt transporter [Pseudoalteromonas atlantica]ALQ55638.1 Cobalt transporter [Pseudoalteromonas issachenkonii]ATC91503.1 cobalt-zinc-cadmium efflux system protein [Pseudoalteromonas issachenkonii]|tara:strand:- start:6505 stop:7407 length:903 start_codon:yes stop_codon:yes gene_type:complete